MLRLFFLFTLAFLPFIMVAQEPDIERSKNQSTEQKHSPDSSDTYYCNPSIFASYELRKIHYPIINFHAYDPAYPSNGFYSSLGNAGQASLPLFFSYNPSHTGEIILRNDVYGIYRLSTDSIRFIQDILPYSAINYSMGKAKEQKLVFGISEQIREKLFLGLDVRYLNAPGLYQRQRAYYEGMDFNLRYVTKNNRYGVLGAFLWDRLAINENGGILNDHDFTQNYESNRRTIGVRLTGASNRNKYSEVLIQQYLNTTAKKYTINHDSIQRKPFFDAGRLVYTFRYSRNGSGYIDTKTDPLYYPAIYNDSSSTYDSIFHSRMFNCLVFSNLEPDTGQRSFPFQYAFGIKQFSDQITLVDTDTASTEYKFSSLQPFITLKGIIRGKTYFSANGKLGLFGFTAGDHEISGVFSQYLGNRHKNRKISLEIKNGMREPDFLFHHYRSNHFYWDLSLLKEIYQSLTMSLIYDGFSLKGNYMILTNYTFLNSGIQPEQYSGTLQVYSIVGKKELWLKNWLFQGEAIYQHIAPDDNLRVPDLVARMAIIYNTYLFKKALKANIGINLTYYTKYKPDSYMPGLRSFYIQDEYKLGGYPYADAFINLKIKRARLFLMYQHFNAGLTGYDYMMVPHYPQPDASLKFGVNWVFHD